MTPKDDLFRLIKSLSKNEKGYFKKQAFNSTTAKNSNYLKLFDAIDRQSEYNEKLIKQKFRNEKFVKQLHVAKNYLFGIILESLGSYHSSIDSELQNQLQRLEILYQKGFYEMCESLVVRIREKAMAVEKYTYVIQALEWERKLICLGARSSANETELNELVSYGNDAMLLLKHHCDYATLHDRMYFTLTRSGAIRNKTQQAKLNALIKDPLFQDESQATTFGNKYFLNSIYDLYNSYSQDQAGIEKAIRFKTKLVALAEANPERIRMRPNMYFALLANLLHFHSAKRNRKQTMICLDKMRSFDRTFKINLSEDLQAKIFFTSHVNELNLYYLEGGFEKIDDRIAEIVRGIEKFDTIHFDPKKLFLHYNVAKMYFGKKDFKSALKWINKILNYEKGGIRTDILCFSKIILLLVHFELENMDILPYLVSSTERFLVKQGRNYGFETALLKFFKRSLLVKSKPEMHDLLQETKDKITEILKDPFEKKVSGFFDFVFWFENKLSAK